MSVPLKWRDAQGVVHSVEEWITWSFNVIDRELSEDADEDDQQSMGRVTQETSCGISIAAEDTFASKNIAVSCLNCLSGQRTK